MSSNKVTALRRGLLFVLSVLLLCSLLAGCTAAEEREAELLAYDPTQTQSTGSKIRTAAAETGRMEMWTPGTTRSYLHFAVDVPVTCAGFGGMRLVELRVSDGTMVQEGDVLAVFEPVYDPQTISELKDQLQIRQLQYAADIFAYDRAVSAAQTAYDNAAEADKELRQIDLTLAQNERNRFVSENSGQITALQARIAVMEGEVPRLELKAPADGTVTDLLYLSETSQIENSTQLCRICSLDNVYLTILYTTDKAYREHNKVMIYCAGSFLCYGTVVSVDPGVNGMGGYVAIQPDEIKDYDTLGNGRKSVTVFGLRYAVENVLSIPTSALNTDGSGTYVYVVRDGTSHKRYVQVGIAGKNADNVDVTQILDGIEPGDLVAAG